MNQLFKNTLAISEDTVRRVLATTIRDPESPFFAKPLTVDGLWDQPAALVWLAEMGAVYFIPESKYYKSEELIGLFKEICVAAETAVHEDGTNDLIISNFRQPEYFHFPLLCQLYRQFEKIGQPTEKEAEAAAKLYYLIERLSQGLLNSGFHTPNHRWVHTSALCYAYNTLKVKDQRFMDLAEKYLAEKIDIDEFGEFSERSAGMYSAISDRALCGIAAESGRPELFEYVKRNLKLVYQYIEDGTVIFTQNSHRKDKGEVGSSMLFLYDRYTDVALDAYAHTQDPEFLHILLSALKATDHPTPTYHNIFVYLEHPELKNLTPDLSALPAMETDFHAFYPDSNIVRAKEKGISYSLLAKKFNFLFANVGAINISARMCSSFFAIAQFQAEEIEQIGEKKYRMTFHAHADYKKPFDVPPANSEKYWTMDYSSRQSISPCDYGYCVDFEFIENGIRMHIRTEGMPNVPFKLEFAVTPGVYVGAGSAMTMGDAGKFICAREGDITLCNYEGDHITIRGAFAEHFYHQNMRGSVSAQNDKFMVYCTGTSPIDKTVEIICEKNHPWDFFA